MRLPESGVLMNNGIMWFDPEAGRPTLLVCFVRTVDNTFISTIKSAIRADRKRRGNRYELHFSE